MRLFISKASQHTFSNWQKEKCSFKFKSKLNKNPDKKIKLAV